MTKQAYREQLINPLSYAVTDDDLADFESFMDWVTDIPSSQPRHPLYINKAGITDREIFINIDDFLNDGRVIPVICSIDAYVDLSAKNRGIHMSRIEEAINKFSKDSFPSLEEYASSLVKEVAARQEAEKAYIFLKGMAIIDRPTLRSGKVSSDRFHLINESRWERSLGLTQRIGFQAFNIAACPCTRAYSKYCKVRELSRIFSLEDVNKILNHVLTFTHSQRGLVTILTDKTGSISTRDLYDTLSRSTHLVFDLLKRPDEHELVRRAHENAQFTEDVARDACVEFLNSHGEKLPKDTYLRIESKLLESIHIHSVHTMIEGTVGELLSQLELSYPADGNPKKSEI